MRLQLETVPGAYIPLGIGDGANCIIQPAPFNDAVIPYSAAFLARLVERASGV